MDYANGRFCILNRRLGILLDISKILRGNSSYPHFLDRKVLQYLVNVPTFSWGISTRSFSPPIVWWYNCVWSFSREKRAGKKNQSNFCSNVSWVIPVECLKSPTPRAKLSLLFHVIFWTGARLLSGAHCYQESVLATTCISKKEGPGLQSKNQPLQNALRFCMMPLGVVYLIQRTYVLQKKRCIL